MPSQQPFQPLTGATTGQAVAVTVASQSSTSGTLDCTGKSANSIMVFNNIAAGTSVWVRMSGEATPTATSTDVLLPPLTAIIFANPNPGGKTGLATIASAASNASVYFTPGNGGLV